MEVIVDIYSTQIMIDLHKEQDEIKVSFFLFLSRNTKIKVNRCSIVIVLLFVKVILFYCILFGLTRKFTFLFEQISIKGQKKKKHNIYIQL